MRICWRGRPRSRTGRGRCWPARRHPLGGGTARADHGGAADRGAAHQGLLAPPARLSASCRRAGYLHRRDRRRDPDAGRVLGVAGRAGPGRRGVTGTRLDLTRRQVLAFRRQAGALGERLPAGRDSLRQAAWAGLQDSMPRAALLSIHARVEGTGPSTWEDPSLVQLWGPRHHVYAVAARDLALFSIAIHPDDEKGRLRAEERAARVMAVI